MTFRRRLAAAIIAAFAASAGAVGPASHLVFAAGSPIAASTTPAGVEVTSDVKHDTSPPLSSLKGLPQVAVTPKERRKHPHAGQQLPTNGDSSTPGTGSAPVAAMPSTTSNFEGLGLNFVGPDGTFVMTGAPSDSNGAVGPNHYMEIVNSSIAVFNKTGTVLKGPVATNTLFTGFGGLCEADNNGDGTVAYDQLANRWVVTQFALDGASPPGTPYLICVAVSQTGDPTGHYYRYSFPYNNFPDYPKLGVWPDGYYLSLNQFNSSGTAFLGAKVAALDRSRMLNGLSATQQTMTLDAALYSSLLPATLDGRTPPPAGSPGYFMDLGPNVLHLWKYHVDWSNPANTTLSSPTTLPVAAFSQACGGLNCIPQSGTTTKLDTLGDRLMYRLAYRNFGDHESLVTNHSVTAGSSTGVRWYEVRSPGASPTVYQQGTYAPDSSYRWMGSVAMDASGDLAAGFSVSSSSLHPQIHYAGRLAGDPLGTMPQGEGIVINPNGSQTVYQNGPLTRWGDYSSLAIDSTDDCTFWYTNQYLTSNGTFNWHTRVGSFKFASCVTPDFSLSVSPSSRSVAQGGSATYTVTIAPTSTFTGAVQLSASGLPAGAGATFSPNPAASTSTMAVTASLTTPTGNSTITVTGTNGSLSHTATTALTVLGAILTYTQSPQGDWASSYGADGYALLGWNGTSDLASLPQSSLILDQGGRWQWTASTTEVRTLQSPDTSTRQAACFYDYSQLRLHLVFPAAYSGILHLYALDWDIRGRRETITINDGSGPRSADITTDFSQGAWINAPINVSAGGSLTISVTFTAGPNAVLSGIFLGGASPIPAAPTSLTASAASSSKIDLGWTGSSGASSYKIQRSPDSSTWAQVGTSTTTSFTDIGLSPSTAYFYRVLASNGSGDSAPSNVASASTGASLIYTPPPQGSWVGTYGADGYALLGWNGNSDLASMPKASLVLDQGSRYQWNASTTAVQVLQSPDTSTRRAACFYDYSQIRLHLVFPAAYSGILHLYALDWDALGRRESITINDGSGPRTADISTDFSQGAWVNAPINVPVSGALTISVTLTAGNNAVLSGVFLGGASPIPAAPTSLTASAASSASINLSWTGSSGASSYKIQRSPDSSTWAQVGSSIINSFTDTGLSPATIYYYRVLASNSSGDSVPSNVASASTGTTLTYTQSPQGNWVGTYGHDGYALLGWNGSSDLVSLPQSSLVLDQGGRYQWTSSTSAVQALQSPDASTRRAACFYDYSQLRLHLVFPAAYSGTLRLYALDWDALGRRESITINDGSGPRTADISTDFSQGAWVNAPINVPVSGALTISVTLTAGNNAVLSGILLG